MISSPPSKAGEGMTKILGMRPPGNGHAPKISKKKFWKMLRVKVYIFFQGHPAPVRPCGGATLSPPPRCAQTMRSMIYMESWATQAYQVLSQAF